MNADKRDVEFVPDRRKSESGTTAGGQQAGAKTMTRPTTQQNQGNESDGKRNAATARGTNEDGSIRPIKKWKDDTFTEQQIKITWRQDGGACQREGRPRAALHEVPEVQLLRKGVR